MTAELMTTLTLLRATAGCPVAPHVAGQIAAFADGNVRVVQDLARVLTPAQLRGGVALPDPLPAVPSAHTDALDDLRTAERRVLLFAALSLGGRVAELLDAAAIDLDLILFGAARAYLTVEDGRVVFLAESVRAQIVDAASAPEVRAAHEALARAARRRGDLVTATWHFAHADPRRAALAPALIAAAEASLGRGELRTARTFALLAARTAARPLAARAHVAAGLAAFWLGELDDAQGCLERAAAGGDPASATLARSTLQVCLALIEGPGGPLFTREQSAEIFRGMIAAARTDADREALTQLAAVTDAVYDRPAAADALQARLFLETHMSSASEPGSGHTPRLTPHVEAHVLLMQVAFQCQFGDLAGAARLLRDAVPRLPLVLPASGIVTSFVGILSPVDPLFDPALIAAYTSIGPAAPLGFDSAIVATIGPGYGGGDRAAAAATLTPRPPRKVELPEASEPLSPRQRDVLLQLVGGRSNRDIADALDLSHRTVEVHVGHVLRKYRVRTRAELLSLLARHSPEADPQTRDAR